MPDPTPPAPTVPPINDPAAIRGCLALRTIAVVGLSDQPYRPSYDVSRYMQRQGYTTIPVNPTIREALGQPASRSPAAIGRPAAPGNSLRRSAPVAAVVDEAIAAGARGLWRQLGVIDPAAAERARAAGLLVVMNRCLKVEHGRRAED